MKMNIHGIEDADKAFAERLAVIGRNASELRIDIEVEPISFEDINIPEIEPADGFEIGD